MNFNSLARPFFELFSDHLFKMNFHKAFGNANANQRVESVIYVY